jgi:hypothetical protein
MKKTNSKSHNDHEMASEYRFDYKKAKPNRFAKKIKLNMAWTVDKFVEEEKPKTKSPKGKKVAKAKAPAKKKATKTKSVAKKKK